MEIITRKQAKEQGLTHYFTGKPCKHGHVAKRLVAGGCVECRTRLSREQEDRRRARRAIDPAFDEAIKAKQRRASANFTRNNPQRRKELRDNWEAVPENRRRRYERNQELKRQPKARTTENKRRRRRHANDHQFAMTMRLRARMHTALNAAMAQKSSTSQKLLGCDWATLVAHLERQFTDGMSWDNYSEWHIDHIRPCASFDLTDPAQQCECFHYTNLQPLWAEDNLRKSDTWAA